MKKIIALILILNAHQVFALPNPASVFCNTHHGKSFIQDRYSGLCVFPDLSYCEQWAYFRGTCKPGEHYLHTDTKDKTNR